jgi:hypothetical protein
MLPLGDVKREPAQAHGPPLRIAVDVTLAVHPPDCPAGQQNAILEILLSLFRNGTIVLRLDMLSIVGMNTGQPCGD